MGEQDVDDAVEEEESEVRAGDSLEEIAEEPASDVETILKELLDEGEGELGPSSPSEGDEGVPVDEDLLETVEERSSETIAGLIARLREERRALTEQFESERERAEDLESRLKRKQADFQNYKKRQQQRLEDEKDRATESLVERLLEVRDNLERALAQDEDADIRGGVESTLAQFDEQLERENVEPIEPEPGDSVEPQRHEVLATISSNEPEDAIATVHRSGYEMAGKVLRPAQVAVSDGAEADSVTDAEPTTDESAASGEPGDTDAAATE